MEKKLEVGGQTFTIRPYVHEEDEEKALQLWRTAFNNEMPAFIWRWKYVNNPYRQAILICENHKKEPVVLYGGIPYRSNYRGREITMVHLADIMSHPEYRKTGLFIHTANAYFDIFGSMEDIFVMYGIPGKYHFDIGAKYLKYSALGEGAAYFIGETDALCKNKRSISGRINEVLESDECFDKLWGQLKGDYPLTVSRDADYMRWRFFDHPLKDYEVWVSKSGFGSACKGYMVLHVEDKKAIVVDLLLSVSEKTAVDFLARVAGMLKERGVETMETWIPEGHFTAKLLMESGFKKKAEPLGIIPTIRLFEKSMELDSACENFYYTMGDGDLF